MAATPPTPVIFKAESKFETVEHPFVEGCHLFYKHHFKKFSFCNYCRDFLYGLGKQAFICLRCRYVSHEKCLNFVSCSCVATTQPPGPIQHHWVEGNLHVNKEGGYDCVVCHKTCGSLSSLVDFRCATCLQPCHSACLDRAPECDLGPFKSLLLAPNQLTLNHGEATLIPSPTTSPLLVFVNKKSGGQQGAGVLAVFYRLLNPRQVFDLGKGGPDPGLDFMSANPRFRVLACGGDGTIGWVLESIRKRGVNPEGVAILPLGTGNDLARSLGWGGGYTGEELSDILLRVAKSTTVLLDRWTLEYAPINFATGEVGAFSTTHVINNYFSIGLDAAIAYEFHTKREANPDAFKSRVGNKFVYVKLGASALFESIEDLNTFFTVEVDGHAATVPLNVGLIMLNLPSCYGGKNLWGTPTAAEVARGLAPITYDDHLFELLTLKSAFELGQVSAGIILPPKLMQGRELKITFIKEGPLPCQVDGEPFVQQPGVLRIRHLHQANMLHSP
ncbi:diacylglycerol kinase beta [Pelomyxa schiedti]|nr:diacylglycerol kinase beta [Pelomyxa schiedti]